MQITGTPRTCSVSGFGMAWARCMSSCGRKKTMAEDQAPSVRSIENNTQHGGRTGTGGPTKVEINPHARAKRNPRKTPVNSRRSG